VCDSTCTVYTACVDTPPGSSDCTVRVWLPRAHRRPAPTRLTHSLSGRDHPHSWSASQTLSGSPRTAPLFAHYPACPRRHAHAAAQTAPFVHPSRFAFCILFLGFPLCTSTPINQHVRIPAAHRVASTHAASSLGLTHRSLHGTAHPPGLIFQALQHQKHGCCGLGIVLVCNVCSS